MVCTLLSVSFDSPPLGYATKTNIIKPLTIDPEIWFRTSFPTENTTISQFYILLADQISLSDCSLLLEILENVCIVIVYYPFSDVFIFKPSSYMTKIQNKN